MKTFIYALCLTLTLGTALPLSAQKPQSDETRYLTGAVPEKNGLVVFEDHQEIPNRTQAELFERLRTYTEQLIATAEERRPESRITELSAETGIIAASIEEYVDFKRNALVWDRAVLCYQLVFEVRDGGYDATIRRIRYRYEPLETPGLDEPLRAEDWITDRKALRKDGKKLTRVGGKKFRVKTIDRAEAVFTAAAQECQ